MNHITEMKCQQINDEDIVERYLGRELSEVEQQAFEEHYFGCTDCFEHLRIARVLKEKPRDIREHGKTVAPPVVTSRGWSYVAAGLVLIAFLGVGYLMRREFVSNPRQLASRRTETNTSMNNAAARRNATIAELAHVDPPPYSPVLMRSGEDQAALRFRRAMRKYEKKDYAAAIPGLEDAARSDPNPAPVNLYLGACYLLTNQIDAAIPPLEKAASASAPDYAEQAHFYLAKAYLLKGDIQKAQVELQITVKFHGDREIEAKDLEQKLGSIL